MTAITFENRHKTGIDINVKKRNIWRTLLSVLAIVAGSPARSMFCLVSVALLKGKRIAFDAYKTKTIKTSRQCARLYEPWCGRYVFVLKMLISVSFCLDCVEKLILLYSPCACVCTQIIMYVKK